MDLFELKDVIRQHGASGKKYFEFLRVPAMSIGLYVLPAGGADLQVPHAEDEAYYVVEGRAMMRVGDEDRAVSAGSIIYVAANIEHRFHNIEEDLKLLVFFAPAEYSQTSGS
jgi:mannose-6-phosphate isomerase-like protein (cupin superfamily)